MAKVFLVAHEIIMACNRGFVPLIQFTRSGSTFKSVSDSLSARGYLRPYKPYSPPTDVEAKLKEIIQKYVSQGSSLSNGRTKFKVLSACFKEFNHSVPNSRLHEVNNTDDLVEFYKTPVDVRIPLEKFKSIELPQNLHIQYEYHRFHPETDTRFNGVSAFPQSSTIVTGLKYKKKYAGYTAKPRWS